MATNLLAGVLEAQTRNSLLAGDELVRAARALVDLLLKHPAVALASDTAGDRIIGAALLRDPSLLLADRSQRFDGCNVMLVTGHISGDAALSARARTARALGAVHVGAAVLSQWVGPIEGCDELWTLGSDRRRLCSGVSIRPRTIST